MKTGILIAALLVLCFGDKTLAETPVSVYHPTPVFRSDAFYVVIENRIVVYKPQIAKGLTVFYNKEHSTTGSGGHKHHKLRQRLLRIPVCAAEPASAMPVVFSQTLIPFADKPEPLLKSAGFPPFQPPRSLS